MSYSRLESIIDRRVRRIVERFDPEQIILFGSAARGEAGPESDVDLLVVMPVSAFTRSSAPRNI
jgi:predicted nucleotidyltransferase